MTLYGGKGSSQSLLPFANMKPAQQNTASVTERRSMVLLFSAWSYSNPNKKILQRRTAVRTVWRSVIERRWASLWTTPSFRSGWSQSFRDFWLAGPHSGLVRSSRVDVLRVARRTGEIAIRMALGPQQRNVPWLVIREVVAVVIAGNGKCGSHRVASTI